MGYCDNSIFQYEVLRTFRGIKLGLRPFGFLQNHSFTMSVPETKELKAEWKAEIELPEYTLKDVAAHNTKGDTWMIIHGQGNNLLK